MEASREGKGALARRQTIAFDAADITPDWFVGHYYELYQRYISNGRPTSDTIATYRTATDIFIHWCQEHGVYPLDVTDYIMGGYLQSLVERGCSDATVALDISAIKTFFKMAGRLGLIKENPCRFIHASNSFHADEEFTFFTTEEIGRLLQLAAASDDPFIRLRDESMILLMGVEGLRVVEVHRMCDEDINWEHSYIFIRGKGHAGRIYPAAQTMTTLKKYLAARPQSTREGSLTPTFVSDHRHGYSRLSRVGVRYIINRFLRAAGLKKNGISCHALRHSCGTNLYQSTRDLRLVQETLRQRNPKVTARYAHVQERMTNRATEALIPDLPADSGA